MELIIYLEKDYYVINRLEQRNQEPDSRAANSQSKSNVNDFVHSRKFCPNEHLSIKTNSHSKL